MKKTYPSIWFSFKLINIYVLFYSETYDYYTLPFCKPDEMVYKLLDFGERLVGDKWASSAYKIPFKENVAAGTKLCERKLNTEELE